MEEGRMLKYQLGYEKLLRAVGRFCDERIYQDELARRCRASHLDVHREVLVRVLHRGFAKPYYLDLLVECGIIYELKCAEMLSSVHQKQLINYLLLTDLMHGKLVNFRPGSVESRFISTRLHRHDRAEYQLADGGWCGDDKGSRLLRETLTGLLADWGAFLDVDLYREALIHFMDGPEAGVRSVDIEIDGSVIGTQKMCMLSPGTAWHLSALRQHLKSYETHVVRLLNHTRLERIHWINLDQRVVRFKTLVNNDSAVNDSVIF